MAGLPKEIYVVVAESDEYIEKVKHGRSVPISFETNCLDLESAKQFKERLGVKYGKTAIYKAVKVEEE